MPWKSLIIYTSSYHRGYHDKYVTVFYMSLGFFEFLFWVEKIEFWEQPGHSTLLWVLQAGMRIVILALTSLHSSAYGLYCTYNENKKNVWNNICQSDFGIIFIFNVFILFRDLGLQRIWQSHPTLNLQYLQKILRTNDKFHFIMYWVSSHTFLFLI